jgi:hypothetical protein
MSRRSFYTGPRTRVANVLLSGVSLPGTAARRCLVGREVPFVDSSSTVVIKPKVEVKLPFDYLKALNVSAT